MPCQQWQHQYPEAAHGFLVHPHGDLFFIHPICSFTSCMPASLWFSIDKTCLYIIVINWWFWFISPFLNLSIWTDRDANGMNNPRRKLICNDVVRHQRLESRGELPTTINTIAWERRMRSIRSWIRRLPLIDLLSKFKWWRYVPVLHKHKDLPC
jgi:hypothetical protein